MSEYWPVVKVDPAWAVDREPMGTKDKFWYQEPERDDSFWLFKFPRENTGEHWAEKMAAEVAGLLEIPHARVELAEVELGRDVVYAQRGSVSESFLAAGSRLIHGNEILAIALPGYDRDMRFGQSQHTLSNILSVLGQLNEMGLLEEVALTEICKYLVLDPIIGNTDRHHENWGLKFVDTPGELSLTVAPSFDHATSLGRELSDERRERILSEGGLSNYWRRGRGGVYWSEGDRYGPSPLQLVRLAYREHQELFHPILTRLTSVDPEDFAGIVERVPAGWMSSEARRFATEFLCYNHRELVELN